MTKSSLYSMNNDILDDDTRPAGRQNSSSSNHSHVSDDEQGPNILFSHLSDTVNKTLVRGHFSHGV